MLTWSPGCCPLQRRFAEILAVGRCFSSTSLMALDILQPESKVMEGMLSLVYLAADSYLLPRVIGGLNLRHKDCDRDGAWINGEAQLSPHHLAQTIVSHYCPNTGVCCLHPDYPQWLILLHLHPVIQHHLRIPMLPWYSWEGVPAGIDSEHCLAPLFNVQNFVHNLQFRREGIWTCTLTLRPIK